MVCGGGGGAELGALRPVGEVPQGRSYSAIS
jgi:hypothetical protein